jgi:hypothetical protein
LDNDDKSQSQSEDEDEHNVDDSPDESIQMGGSPSKTILELHDVVCTSTTPAPVPENSVTNPETSATDSLDTPSLIIPETSGSGSELVGAYTSAPEIPLDASAINTISLPDTPGTAVANSAVFGGSVVAQGDDPAWMVEASQYLLAIEGQGKEWKDLVRTWVEIERALKYPDAGVWTLPHHASHLANAFVGSVQLALDEESA